MFESLCKSVTNFQGLGCVLETNHIIIAGSGRVGGIVERMLRASGYSSTVIDFSSKQIDTLKLFGLRTYFGDATRPDLLHAAGIADAKLLVIAIDNKEQISELTRYVVHTYPNVHVIARAVDRMHVYDLWAAGCRDIIRETYDSSLRIGRSSLEALGTSTDNAQKMTDVYNAMDRRSMVELADAYDPDIPISENTEYIERAKRFVEDMQPQLDSDMQKIKDS